MNFRKLSAAVVLSASLLSTASAFAAPTHINVPVNAVFGRAKMIGFQMRNDSNETLNLMAGATAIKLEKGQTTSLKLAPGEKIVAQEASLTRKAGDVVLVVSDSLSSATVVIR